VLVSSESPGKDNPDQGNTCEGKRACDPDLIVHAVFPFGETAFFLKYNLVTCRSPPFYQPIRETFEKRSILFKAKKGENFNLRNTLSILRVKI
jgi:hypothetical protein